MCCTTQIGIKNPCRGQSNGTCINIYKSSWTSFFVSFQKSCILKRFSIGIMRIHWGKCFNNNLLSNHNIYISVDTEKVCFSQCVCAGVAWVGGQPALSLTLHCLLWRQRHSQSGWVTLHEPSTLQRIHYMQIQEQTHRLLLRSYNYTPQTAVKLFNVLSQALADHR